MVGSAIAPAGTDTNISAGATFPADRNIDLLTRMAALRGMAASKEIAAVFAFLASDECRSVTGVAYTVDNRVTVR